MNHRTRRFTSTLLFAVLLSVAFAAAQTVRVNDLPESVIKSRLEQAADKNDLREATEKSLFTSSGCDAEHLSELPVKGEKVPNLVCVLPGKSGKWIVIGAHTDKVESGHGVVDNWSGASLLPSLYESLRTVPREHTLIFVAFTAEEKGMIGSRDYVKKLSKQQRQNISAMINLDTLGLGPTVVWLSHADKRLVDMLATVANYMKLPLGAVNVEGVGSTDSESFRNEKIPSMTVHSLTQETLGILHSDRDRAEALTFKEYYSTYRLLALYLAYIDVKLDAPPPAPPQ